MSKSDLEQLLNAVGPNGLRRAQANAFPDKWADMIGLSIHGKAYTFAGREYLREITRNPNREIAFRKSAQMGATVTAIIRTLHHVIEWEWNGLYLLPTKAGTGTFSQGRIDTVIQSSKMLKSYFASVDNSNHKKTQKANLYIRGTNVVNDLREIPVDFEVWDERDKMVEDNLPIALTRMDGSPHKHVFKLSTPLTPEFGIDADFLESDQRFWYIKCPHCNHQLTLDWDEHVVIDEDNIDNTHLACDKCRKRITHAQMIDASSKGEWIATEPQATRVSGYHINQLYSPTIEIDALGRQWLKGQEDDKFLRELYNSALGLGYVQKGDKLTEDVLDKCRSDYTLRPDGYLEGGYDQHLNIGIDVQGAGLHHVSASYFTSDYRRRKVLLARMKWDEIYQFLGNLQNGFTCVIDAHPEKQKAKELAAFFWGRVFVATYVESTGTGELAKFSLPKTRGEIGEVLIDRTLGFDTFHSHYFRNQVLLPANARDLGGKERDVAFGGFYRQMTTQVRQIFEDNRGNPIARYVKPGKKSHDHWDHADLYEGTAATLVVPSQGLQPVVEQRNNILRPQDIGIPQEEFNVPGMSDTPFGGAFGELPDIEPIPFDPYS